MKAHKILDINFDGDELHFDLRVSVPRNQMSNEFIVDILRLKPQMISGAFFPENAPRAWLSFQALIETNEAGEHTVSIQKTAQELL